MKKYFLALFIIKASIGICQDKLPYKDASLSAEIRAADLLKRMTPGEKFWQMFMIPGDLDNAGDSMYRSGIFGLQVSAIAKGDAAGQMLNYNTTENAFDFARKLNRIQKFFVEKTRLGIPVIFFDEALHGLVRSDATVYPQAIGLAATFDTALMQQVAASIAGETKVRGVRQVLSPVINIASDVRWGRVEETYGEDPYLSSRMAAAFVNEFEKNGIITTPKHFIANVGDGGRDSYPISYNERRLDEIFFPPFEAAFQSGARSVMTAYNSLDGISCSSNSWLLEKKLKKDWKFKGFVISDANAVGGDVVLLHTAKNYADAGTNAINGGLDVIFQTEYDHSKLFMPPFLDGRIDSNRINDAVLRVLKAKFELGLFDHPYTSEDEAQKTLYDTSAKKIARQAALESIVLLKNRNGVLPLRNTIRRIALIGEDAGTVRLGGYSGPGNHPVSILEAMKKYAAGNLQIAYAKGATVQYKEYNVIAPEYLKSQNQKEGLTAYYFNNISLSGQPVVEKQVDKIDFLWTLSSPDKAIKNNFYSARWSGKIRSPKTGNYKIGIEGNDGFRLYLNGTLLIDNWQKVSYHSILKDFFFEKNKEYDIRVEFFEPVGNAKIRLVWNVDVPDVWRQQIAEAVKVARQSDVAVITAGIHEGEFQDRAILSLPGHQEDLINAVAETGKPVIVILVGGSAITMKNWLHNAGAVLDMWYGGEEGGNAVCDVLFGKYSPAGRLPITFPIFEGQLPLVYDHKPTGRGDDYYDLSGLPLFPFGYGLSYTSFEYTNMRLEKNDIGTSDSVNVFFTLKNSGSAAGDEVAQLYIHDVLASVSQPVIALKGFQRIHLAAGESKEIKFMIKPDMLSLFDKDLQRVVEPGNFQIMIGASSRDIRLKDVLTVK